MLQCRGVSRVKVCVRPPASISPAALERRSLPDKRPVAIVVEAPFRELRSGQPRLLEFGWEAIRPVIPKRRMACRRSMTGARGTASSAASAQARHAPPDKVRNGAALKPAGSTDGGRRLSGRGPWKRCLGQAVGAVPERPALSKQSRLLAKPLALLHPGLAGFPQAGRARSFSRAARAHATLKRLADR